MSDRDFRQQRISASYHPFAYTESGSMVGRCRGRRRVMALAARGAVLGAWLLARLVCRGMFCAEKWQISRWVKLVIGRPTPTTPRYASWQARS